MRLPANIATATALALVSSSGSLQAEPTTAVPTYDYRSVYRGLVLGGGFEVGPYGQAVPAMAGAQTAGIETFAGRQLLLTWDAAGGVVGGYGGNEHPGFLFVGGRARASGELGYRFFRRRALSPYVGGAVDFAFSAVVVPSAPAGGPNAANSVDGLAGAMGQFATRCHVGASYLTDRQSLELTLFVEEAIRPTGGAPSAALFYEAGIHAQYDAARSFSLLVEALYGSSAKRSEGSIGATTEANYKEARLDGRARLGKGFWIGLKADVALNGNTTTYRDSTITYGTSGPLSSSAAVLLGIPIE